MDQRFDWFPLIDSELLNELLLIVTTSINNQRNPKGQSKEQLLVVKQQEELIIKQLLSALYQSYFVIPIGTSQVSIPLSSGQYTNSGYSYRIVKRVYDVLSSLGWINIVRGSEAKGKVTRISAKDPLVSRFDEYGLKWLPQEPKSPELLVQLRHYKNPEGKTKKAKGKKIELPLPETDEVNQLRSSLYAYNQFLIQQCVALDLNDDQLNDVGKAMQKKANDEPWKNEEDDQYVSTLDFHRLQLRRIFSRGSMELGGRFYGGWWQSIPSLYRPHITINEYKTVEIDYSSMSLRILYSQRGIDVSPNEDLYDIGLDNWLGGDDPRRKPIKTYINAVLNDESGNYRLAKVKQELVGISHYQLHDLVLKRHKGIADLLSSGVGLQTQYIDSQIAELVMQRMMEEEVLVLPIHDSFIVRKGYQADLADCMQEAFTKLTGAIGSVDIEGSRSSQHFGMQKETLAELNIDPSYGIYKGEEVFKEIFERQSSIMNKYLLSWRSYT